MYKKVLFLIVLVLIIVLTAYSLQSNRKSSLVQKTPVATLSVTKKVISRSNGNPWPKETAVRIHIEYPQLAIGNASVEKIINNDIESFVASLKKDLGDWDAKDIGTPIDQATLDEYGSDTPVGVGDSVDISYKVEGPHHNTVTCVFEISSYNFGAAHPNYYTKTRVYDINTGKLMTLGNFIKSDAATYEKLATTIRQKLKQEDTDEKLTDESWLKEGTDPNNPSYFESFILKENGLEFIFDPYQIAPYAAGGSRALIPFSELEEILSSKSTLGI